MAKPIRPTPTVTGEAAKVIHDEIKKGTPNTTQRIETIKRADEAFRRDIAPLLKNRAR